MMSTENVREPHVQRMMGKPSRQSELLRQGIYYLCKYVDVVYVRGKN